MAGELPAQELAKIDIATKLAIASLVEDMEKRQVFSVAWGACSSEYKQETRDAWGELIHQAIVDAYASHSV